MANDFFDALCQVINPSYCLALDSQNRLILSEEQNSGRDGSGQTVTLKRKGKVFAFSLDQKGKGDIFPFFNNTTGGIKKCNDAILFCLDGDQWYVFVIELKSGNPRDGILQLKAGRNFVEYLLRTIELHFQKRIQAEFRYIVFHTRKTSAKRPTRRLARTPEFIDGLEVYLERCNQSFGLEEFFVS